MSNLPFQADLAILSFGFSCLAVCAALAKYRGAPYDRIPLRHVNALAGASGSVTHDAPPGDTACAPTAVDAGKYFTVKLAASRAGML